MIAPPGGLVLRAGDVAGVYGRGYRLLLQRPVPNSAARAPSIVVGLATNTRARQGRISGFFDEFVRTFGTAFKNGRLSVKPGVSAVLCAVNAYRDTAGPRLQVQAALGYRVNHVTGLTYHVRPLAGVGEQAALHTSVSATIRAAPASYNDIVFFRQGTYAVTVSVTAYGSLGLAPVVRLARIVDARIRRGR